VAFKVITSLRTPDHSTIAEFRRRHEADIAELFDDVLGLCREAGLVWVGVITIDGTKIKANASMDQNRSYRDLVTEILREAEETDRREDELYGQARGDELPEQLRTAEGRRQALARGGRREWFRVARSELEAHRARQAAPIARDREDRLLGVLDRQEGAQLRGAAHVCVVHETAEGMLVRWLHRCGWLGGLGPMLLATLLVLVGPAQAAIYDDAALVEVSDRRTGEALDLFVVPADQLKVTWRSATRSAPGMEA
jgi:hypothetical protein